MRIIDESIMTGDAERKMQYNNYLKAHIGFVNKAFHDFILPVLQEDESISAQQIADIQDQIVNHDKCKYDDEEYYGYLQWFYPAEGEKPDRNLFNYAWNQHQHNAKHHWQHWICRSDNDEDTILDMDLASVLEMLCDWSSFQFMEEFDMSGNAHDWYKDHGKKMLLSDNTRKLVEEYLDKCEGL